MLRPQDLVVALHYALNRGIPRTMAATASMLGLTASEVHTSLRRAAAANLLSIERKGAREPMSILASADAIIELVKHGVRYVYPVERGPETRGVPTAHGVAPLNRIVRSSGPPPVWPHRDGTIRGEGFSPLYKHAHVAAGADPKMYQALAMIDGIRGGRAREREAAKTLFVDLLSDASRRSDLPLAQKRDVGRPDG